MVPGGIQVCPFYKFTCKIFVDLNLVTSSTNEKDTVKSYIYKVDRRLKQYLQIVIMQVEQMKTIILLAS